MLGAFLGGRYLPADMGRDLSQHTFEFLTTPMKGGLTALGLVGGGALVGGIAHFAMHRGSSSEKSADRATEPQETIDYKQYLKVESSDLDEDEMLSIVACTNRIWGEDFAREVVKGAVLGSGQVEAETVEKVDPTIVEGVLDLVTDHPSPLSSVTKQKILAGWNIQVGETVVSGLTEEQILLLAFNLSNVAAQELTNDRCSVQGGKIWQGSPLEWTGARHYAEPWNEAIVLLHGAIHGPEQR